MRDPISVCLATFNGERYISEQLGSIIKQLSSHDEIIVVDDCSTDNTVREIKKINDNRITCYTNSKNRGEIYTFFKSISLSKNKYIFLSDQDDVWCHNKVDRILSIFSEKKPSLITSAFINFNNEDHTYTKLCNPLRESNSNSLIKNLYKILSPSSSYLGCCMTIDRNLLEYIYPYPEFIESHDLYIASVANFLGSNYHTNEPLIMRRLHSNNLSYKKRAFINKIYSRIILVRMFLHILVRISAKK